MSFQILTTGMCHSDFVKLKCHFTFIPLANFHHKIPSQITAGFAKGLLLKDGAVHTILNPRANPKTTSFHSFYIKMTFTVEPAAISPCSPRPVHHSVSSPPVRRCVVGVLAQYGCRRIIQVDEEIPPYYLKHFECLEKSYINVTNYYY